MTSNILGLVAAAGLLITAGYHLTGTRETSAGLAAERSALIRAA